MLEEEIQKHFAKEPYGLHFIHWYESSLNIEDVELRAAYLSMLEGSDELAITKEGKIATQELYKRSARDFIKSFLPEELRVIKELMEEDSVGYKRPCQRKPPSYN